MEQLKKGQGRYTHFTKTHSQHSQSWHHTQPMAQGRQQHLEFLGKHSNCCEGFKSGPPPCYFWGSCNVRGLVWLCYGFLFSQGLPFFLQSQPNQVNKIQRFCTKRHLWGIIPFFFSLPLGIKHISGLCQIPKPSPAVDSAVSAALKKGWEQRHSQPWEETFPALGRCVHTVSPCSCLDVPAAAQLCWLQLWWQSQYSALLLTLIHPCCPTSFWNKSFSLCFIPLESVHFSII